MGVSDDHDTGHFGLTIQDIARQSRKVFSGYLRESCACPDLLALKISTPTTIEIIYGKRYGSSAAQSWDRKNFSELVDARRKLATRTLETKGRCHRFFEAKKHQAWLTFISSNVAFWFTSMSRCLLRCLSFNEKSSSSLYAAKGKRDCKSLTCTVTFITRIAQSPTSHLYSRSRTAVTTVMPLMSKFKALESILTSS